MFNQMLQPLAYAEALLAQFTNLSRASDVTTLQSDFVRSMAELSGCELAQLYLLDATNTCLGLNAEYLDGNLRRRETASVPTNYNSEQLLQFSMCQNRVVCISELSGSLHKTDFLPNQARPWQSLLCVPLVNQQKSVVGLLLCASHQHIELRGFADSFGRLGAFVLNHLHLLLRSRRPSDEASPVSAAVPTTSGNGITGKSAVMRRVYSLISKVSHSSYTVLLTGETGTGKDVIARTIHESGPRRSQAFIVQNCAAVPENLLESELFGYRKGAFTGAERDRSGLFDAANGGTLLLDEIGDMPLSLQAKLLRVLQEGEVRPLGSNHTHTIDVRIIAATHQDLSVLVKERKFREDLYYRLAQFPIELPALRRREGDILDLARHFADKACALLQRDEVSWSNEVLELLARYAFPGNVRELKGLVERAVLLCEGSELLVKHFPLRMDTLPELENLNLRDRLKQVERNLLIDCLRKNAGNQTLCARELGLPRRTFLYRLERLNINAANVDV